MPPEVINKIFISKKIFLELMKTLLVTTVAINNKSFLNKIKRREKAVEEVFLNLWETVIEENKTK